MYIKQAHPNNSSTSIKPFVSEYRLNFKGPSKKQPVKKVASKVSAAVDAIAPPMPRAVSESTSLTLPGMMEKTPVKEPRFQKPSTPVGHYNIITGVEIESPSSGFKEGQRAFVKTFARTTQSTNARTSGYNIISGVNQ